MYCNQCGALLSEDANFCINCGHKIVPPPTGFTIPKDILEKAPKSTEEKPILMFEEMNHRASAEPRLSQETPLGIERISAEDFFSRPMQVNPLSELDKQEELAKKVFSEPIPEVKKNDVDIGLQSLFGEDAFEIPDTEEEVPVAPVKEKVEEKIQEPKEVVSHKQEEKAEESESLPRKLETIHPSQMTDEELEQFIKEHKKKPKKKTAKDPKKEDKPKKNKAMPLLIIVALGAVAFICMKIFIL